jgi:hypothetical protein
LHGPSKAESILDEIDRRYVKSDIQLNLSNTLQHCALTSFPWTPKV